VWFKSVYLKTLREFRIAIFGWGLGIGLLMYVVFAAFPSLVTTPQARASLIALAQGFAWLAEPVKVDTPGGYATFKYGPTILLLAVWALAAGARALRGEEERGSIDVLLSLPESRVRLAIEKLGAIWTALLGIGLLMALVTFAGVQRTNAGLRFIDVALFALNVVLTSGVFAAIALLISQFTRERGTASGITGILFVLSIVVDMVHRIFPNTEWISQLSPVYYYNLSRPLVPGYGANAGAMVGLFAASVVLSAAGIWLFARRDVGGTVSLPSWLRLPERATPPERALPVNDWALRSIYTRSLAMIAWPTLWWTLGIAGFAAWMIVVAKQTETLLITMASSSAILKTFITSLGGSNAVSGATLLSALWAFLPVALMAFAVTQASRWASDEEEGRLELILATPQSRLQVILGRFAGLATATVLIGLVTLAATAAASAGAGLTLDAGNLAAASLAMIPLGLLVAALGYLFSGWLRAAFDTGLLTFLLAIWFFISFLGPGFNWPDALQRLSPLYYYGTPLLHGIATGGTIGILAVSLVALGIGAYRFTRKDIAV
jgi:ABC-2 type transport system permease protein